MVDCLRPFLKTACLQLPIQVFKEWIDRLGFSFFVVQGVGMKTRIFKLGTSLDINRLCSIPFWFLTALMYIFASKFNDRHGVCNKMSTSD